MYYALAGIFGILMFLFIGLWQEKKSECNRLRQEKKDLSDREQAKIDNLKDLHEHELNKRDIQILLVLTKKNRLTCIKILQKIKEKGKYYDFIEAETVKQMQDIIKEATE